MPNSLFGFEKLVTWQKARALSLELYKLTADFPGEEKFGLVSQIRRAAVSVSANIAEGAGRSTGNDKAHFSTQAYGSLMELLNLLILSADIGYISPDTSAKLRADIEEIARLLSGLRNAQLKTAKRKP